MISLLKSTGSKTLIPRGYMNAAGVKKTFARVAMKTDTGDIDLWTPAESGGEDLTVEVSPIAVYGYGAGPYATLVGTETVTASSSDAVGAVTWVWAFDSGDAAILITDDDAAYTTFYATVDPGSTLTADFTVTGTDSIGRTGEATVSVSLTNYLWGGY